jgi:hypothetical protein
MRLLAVGYKPVKRKVQNDALYLQQTTMPRPQVK